MANFPFQRLQADLAALITRSPAGQRLPSEPDLAKQLGVSLGKIVNFSESSGGYPYPMMAYGIGGGPSDKAVTPTVPVGENTYNASISITYEIR